MQYKQLAAVAAFAGLANAQSQCASIVQGFDPCLLGPIASVAYSSFSCDIIDFACQCSNLEGIANTAIPAAAMPPNSAATCNGANNAIDVAQSLCDCHTSNSASSITLNQVQSICEPTALMIPACALGYIADSGNQDFGCDIQDFACQCSNSNAIQGKVLASVTSLCGLNYAVNTVLPAVAAVCACVTSNAGATDPGTPATTTPTGGDTTAPGTLPTTSPTVGGVTSTPATTPTGTASPSSAPTSSGAKTSGVTSGGVTSGGVMTSGGASSPSTAGGTTSPIKQSGPTTGVTSNLPHFTGAGATASAFGGLFGVVAGVVAFL